LTLITSFGASNTAWHNLAGFADVGFQRFQIFVINFGETFRSEAAVFAAAEKNGPW